MACRCIHQSLGSLVAVGVRDRTSPKGGLNTGMRGPDPDSAAETAARAQHAGGPQTLLSPSLFSSPPTLLLLLSVLSLLCQTGTLPCPGSVYKVTLGNHSGKSCLNSLVPDGPSAQRQNSFWVSRLQFLRRRLGLVLCPSGLFPRGFQQGHHIPTWSLRPLLSAASGQWCVDKGEDTSQGGVSSYHKGTPQ